MFYSIRHITRYRYDAPVRESIMQLYMQPKSEGPQRLRSFQVATTPRAALQAYTDHFGNAVYHFDVPSAHQELLVEVEARLADFFGVVAPVPALELVLAALGIDQRLHVGTLLFDFCLFGVVLSA
jgi:transglutaminase-like putative cysteine protease